MKPATFKYGLTLPIVGSHKLKRFAAWAAEHAPTVAYRLPPQAPIDTETLTVRLSAVEDRNLLISIMPSTLP